MELRHLRSFVTVATAGSISRGARQLDLAQPAVSQHIHALELELGVLLFRRTSRGVALTEPGMALFGPASSLLAAESDARTSIQQMVFEARAEVQIAAIPTVAGTLLPRAALLLQDPAAPLRLRVFERASVDSLALLASRTVELAIVRDLEPNSGVLSEELWREPLVLAVPGDHPLASRGDVTLASFRNDNFLMFDYRQGFGLHRMAIDACAAAGFVPRIVCEGPEAGTIGQMIALGVGVAIVPRSGAALWEGSNVAVLPLDATVPETVVTFAWLPGQQLSDGSQRVMRALRRAALTAGPSLPSNNESR